LLSLCKDFREIGAIDGKTGAIDHPSPVCSEQSVLIRISNSLIIDIKVLTKMIFIAVG